MPRYKLSNGKVIFSETKLSPEELEEYESEAAPKKEFEPLTGISFNEPRMSVDLDPSNLGSVKPLPPEIPQEEPGFLEKVLSTLTTPVANIGLSPEMRAYSEEQHPILGRALNFGTDVLSGLSTPLNIGTAGAFAGESALAGITPQIARALGWGARGASAGVATQGGYHLANAKTGPEAVVAAIELLGGGYGMKQGLPKISKSIIAGEIPKVPVRGTSGSNQLDDLLENIVREPDTTSQSSVVSPDVSSPSSYGPVKEGTPHVPASTPFTTDQYTLQTLVEDIAYLKERKQPIPPELTARLEELTGKKMPGGEVKPQHTIVDTKNPQPKNLITDGADVIDEMTGEVVDMNIKPTIEVNAIGDYYENSSPIKKNLPSHLWNEEGLTEAGHYLRNSIQRGREQIGEKSLRTAGKDIEISLRRLTSEEQKRVTLRGDTRYAGEKLEEFLKNNPDKELAPIQIGSTEHGKHLLDGHHRWRAYQNVGREPLVFETKIVPGKVGESKVRYIDETQAGAPPIKPPVKPPVLATQSTLPGKPKLTLDTKRGVYVDKATGEEIPLNDKRLRRAEDVEVPPNEKISPQVAVKLPEPPKEATKLQKTLNLPRSIQAAYDISFPFRQGLGLIHTKGWWTSWDDMLKSYGSEGAYNAVMESIEQKPNYQRITDPTTGKVKPSFADEAGLKVGRIDDIRYREETMQSDWAEKLPGVRASNRAYSAFANKLRSDNFDALIELAEKTSKGEASLNPRTNLVLAKSIAEFVNNASGRGRLPGALEKSAETLNGLFFSPRLIASRVQYMNPNNYIHGDPLVRKEYLKSLVAMGIAWTAVAGLAKLGGADVSFDTNSADFGKVKIGNTRLDPAGGFQQYLVLISRLANQGRTDSNTEKFSPYGKGYKAPTFGDDFVKFVRNKLAPIPSYVTSPFFADEKFPFEVGDETIRLFMPMIAQDLVELLKEDPTLLPGIGLSAVGMGVQSYGDREPGRILPESIFPRKSDIRFPLNRR